MHYLRIPLAMRGQASLPAETGVYCPPNWRPQAGVEVILYLHGIRDPRVTVKTYWDARLRPQFALREELTRSQRNAVLVVPLLGPRSQDQIGRLAHAGGLDGYLKDVLQKLVDNQVLAPGVGLSSLIIACHSGGGQAMRLICAARNDSLARLRECWEFDCLYGVRITPDDASFWSAWARANSSRRLRIYYQSTTANQSQKLARMKIPNVSVELLTCPQS